MDKEYNGSGSQLLPTAETSLTEAIVMLGKKIGNLEGKVFEPTPEKANEQVPQASSKVHNLRNKILEYAERISKVLANMPL
jgi:hypothetical protein